MLLQENPNDKAFMVNDKTNRHTELQAPAATTEPQGFWLGRQASLQCAFSQGRVRTGGFVSTSQCRVNTGFAACGQNFRTANQELSITPLFLHAFNADAPELTSFRTTISNWLAGSAHQTIVNVSCTSAIRNLCGKYYEYKSAKGCTSMMPPEICFCLDNKVFTQ